MLGLLAIPLLTSMTAARAADWPAAFGLGGEELKLHPLGDQPACSSTRRAGAFYLYARWTPPRDFDLARSAAYACSTAKFECVSRESASLELRRGHGGTGSWSYRGYPTLGWIQVKEGAIETFYRVQGAQFDRNDADKLCVEAADIVQNGAGVPAE